LALGAISTGLAAMGVRAQAPLKVGVIYNTPISDVGWNFQHHGGIQAMERAFPGKVEWSLWSTSPKGPTPSA
jgi:basic membrane protein A and related proteins